MIKATTYLEAIAMWIHIKFPSISKVAQVIFEGKAPIDKQLRGMTQNHSCEIGFPNSSSPSPSFYPRSSTHQNLRKCL
jgi:hypothetical protein